MAFDAVLFDYDGVLADTEGLHYECWRSVLAPRGIRLEWESYRLNCVGVSDRETLRYYATLADPRVTPESIAGTLHAKQAMYREQVRANPPVYEETLELIRALPVPIAVVTSSDRAEVEPVLESLGIHGCFGARVFGDEVKRVKPAPDPYLEAAARLNVARPLVVEDSDPGEAAGRAAGFEVLRIATARDVAKLVRERLGLA